MSTETITHADSDYSGSRQRAAVYGLLGRVWVSEIDRSFAELVKRDTDFQRQLTDCGLDLTALLTPFSRLEELAQEYCRLFLGPTDHLPPYQSVWIEGQFAGQPSVDMRAWCEIARVEPSSVGADQLGVQLTVMSRIVESEQLEAERKFFQQHLTWTRPLTRVAERRAATEFYRSFIRLTAEFLESERTALVDRA